MARFPALWAVVVSSGVPVHTHSFTSARQGLSGAQTARSPRAAACCTGFCVRLLDETGARALVGFRVAREQHPEDDAQQKDDQCPFIADHGQPSERKVA